MKVRLIKNVTINGKAYSNCCAETVTDDIGQKLINAGAAIKIERDEPYVFSPKKSKTKNKVRGR